MRWLHEASLGCQQCPVTSPPITLPLLAQPRTHAHTQVPPDELTWHISEALRVARPSRIGHGVGLPFETQAAEVLATMREGGVVIEVGGWVGG